MTGFLNEYLNYMPITRIGLGKFGEKKVEFSILPEYCLLIFK